MQGQPGAMQITLPSTALQSSIFHLDEKAVVCGAPFNKNITLAGEILKIIEGTVLTRGL